MACTSLSPSSFVILEDGLLIAGILDELEELELEELEDDDEDEDDAGIVNWENTDVIDATTLSCVIKF
jgi:hypothetical protein